MQFCFAFAENMTDNCVMSFCGQSTSWWCDVPLCPAQALTIGMPWGAKQGVRLGQGGFGGGGGLRGGTQLDIKLSLPFLFFFHSFFLSFFLWGSWILSMLEGPRTRSCLALLLLIWKCTRKIESTCRKSFALNTISLPKKLKILLLSRLLLNKFQQALCACTGARVVD